MKRALLIIITAFSVIIVSCFTGCSSPANNSGKNTSAVTQAPSPSSVEQQASSIVNEAVENMKGDPMKVAKTKAPDYPFDQIPLYMPAMMVIAGEQKVDNDTSAALTYYTSAKYDEAVEYYKQALGKYQNFSETATSTSSGKADMFSFSLSGTHDMDCGVEVLEVPSNPTGYTCTINAQVAIRGANKKEVTQVEIGPDGIPTNFPQSDVPIFKLDSIDEVEGQSDGGYVMFESSGTVQEAVQFYHDKLGGEPGFSESTSDEDGIIFSCTVKDWNIDLIVQDSSGHAYIEINYNPVDD